MELQDLVDRVQTTINEVKANGADYVIIVAHLGKDGDALAENTSVGLLKKLKC